MKPTFGLQGQVAAAEFSSYQAIVTRRYFYSGPLLGLVLWTVTALAQPRAWFADGYHGGVYGHYPPSFTRFMLDALRAASGLEAQFGNRAGNLGFRSN